MTEKAHAAPPAVCPDCLNALFASITPADERILFLHCAHKSRGTLLRVRVSAGVVTSWRLQAPVTLAQAKEEIADHARLLEHAGLLPPPPGAGSSH
jgi:hypothetical protein